MMKKLDIDSSARLIHEAIQQLGWPTDSVSLINRVKRLDLGLPAEDEIAFILSWLGKCSIIHRLDQNQYPPKSGDKYQVPDLLASFVVNGESLPVLLEVKVSKKKKLSWKESYFNKIKNYSSLIGLPLLLAWKFHRLWLLVDLNCFEKARTNYHLSFEAAMKHNLMSYLAGDFVYVMQPNVGLHFHFKKERLVSKKQLDASSREVKWLTRIEKAFFVNSEGKKVSKLPSGLWPLFISAEPVSEDRVEDDYIYQSFVISKDSGMHFAHSALPILINFFMDIEDKIHWRKQLYEHNFPVDFNIFSEAASKGIKKGFVKYVIYQKPFKIPPFLKHLEKAEQRR
jgi:Holliday junction resolvase